MCDLDMSARRRQLPVTVVGALGPCDESSPPYRLPPSLAVSFHPFPWPGRGGDEEVGLEGDFPAWNPGDVVMAAVGTFETCRPAVTMSVSRGILLQNSR